MKTDARHEALQLIAILSMTPLRRKVIMKRTRVHKQDWLLRPLSLPLAMLVLLAPARAQQTQIKLDPAKTRIAWALGDVLHTVEGTFQLKSGAIRIDRQTGEANGEIIVDAGSGDSGNGMRDSKMKKEVLETTKYRRSFSRRSG